MKHIPSIALFMLCLLVAVACETEDGGGAKESVTVGTWNVGLAYNFVPLAKERQPEVVKALSGATEDVLCLQEVWTDDDLAALETAAKAAGFTEVYQHKTPEDTAGLAAACTEGDTKELGPCAQKNCEKAPDLVGCVQEKCGPQLAAISGSCLTCLASNLSLTLPQILDKCGKEGAAYSWGGYNGLMLLSRKPLTNKKHTLLDSALVRRSVLTAEIAAPGGSGTIQVACTHLTAGLESIKYPGTFKNWEEEQAAQVDALLKMMRPAADGPSVILGDLNASPEKTGITGEYKANYAKFGAAGYASPYADQSAPKCTFCGSNLLVSGGADKGGEDSILDHVLTRGWSGTVGSPARTYDGTVSVTAADGKKDTNLSDHFGVSVKLTSK
ncbi:MAG: endonuclease/exonuclease/phosphatase family protein [Myxococcales bacterium]|nr:endonuclease/exonuclease/phosphatase family protein [Myxococcales bacterium]